MRYLNSFVLKFKGEIGTLAIPCLFLFFLAVLVPTNGLGSTGIICVLIWLLWREPEFRSNWWKVIWPWLLVVLVYFIVMSTYSLSAVTALRDGGEVLKGVALSAVALHLLQLPDHYLRSAVEYVVIVLLVATIAIVIFSLYHVGFVQLISNSGFDWFVNRNRLAVGFSITAIFLFSLMIEERLRWKSVLWSGAFVFVCFAAFLNGSRGAIIGMLCAIACVALTASLRLGWRQMIRVELLFLPFLSIFALIFFIYYQNISLIKFYIHDSGIDTGRFIIWHTIVEKLAKSPWIGYGPHAIKNDVFLMSYGLEHFSHPHSIYVGLAYASGLVGVIFWLVWFGTFISKIRESFKAQNNIAFYLGLGVLVNTLVHGFTDFDFYMLATMTFLVFGVVMMTPRININKG